MRNFVHSDGAADMSGKRRRVCANGYLATQTSTATERLEAVVDAPYTTLIEGATRMAFLRRKGNTFYLVHNVRQRGKVKQLHLARLGERPRITDDVVQEVSRAYPGVAVDWTALRESVNSRDDVFDPNSSYVRKLVTSLRNLNLELGDLFPPLLKASRGRAAGADLVTQLRLLHSTVGYKLDQFDRSPRTGLLQQRNYR
jgi:hypothetical protein